MQTMETTKPRFDPLEFAAELTSELLAIFSDETLTPSLSLAERGRGRSFQSAGPPVSLPGEHTRTEV